MTHDPKHEELVMRVVTGELGEDAPEWREQRASCAQCEARRASPCPSGRRA